MADNLCALLSLLHTGTLRCLLSTEDCFACMQSKNPFPLISAGNFNVRISRRGDRVPHGTSRPQGLLHRGLLSHEMAGLGQMNIEAHSSLCAPERQVLREKDSSKHLNQKPG